MQAVLIGRIKSLDKIGTMCCPGLGGGGEARKAYRRYVAEGATQGSRRGRIPRVRLEIAERLVKEVGMSLEVPARLMGISTSAISEILRENNQKKHGVIQLPLSHGMNVRNAKSGI